MPQSSKQKEFLKAFQKLKTEFRHVISDVGDNKTIINPAACTNKFYVLEFLNFFVNLFPLMDNLETGFLDDIARDLQLYFYPDNSSHEKGFFSVGLVARAQSVTWPTYEKLSDFSVWIDNVAVEKINISLEQILYMYKLVGLYLQRGIGLLENTNFDKTLCFRKVPYGYQDSDTCWDWITYYREFSLFLTVRRQIMIAKQTLVFSPLFGNDFRFFMAIIDKDKKKLPKDLFKESQRVDFVKLNSLVVDENGVRKPLLERILGASRNNHILVTHVDDILRDRFIRDIAHYESTLVDLTEVSSTSYDKAKQQQAVDLTSLDD